MQDFLGGVLVLSIPVTYVLIIFGCARIGKHKGGSSFNWGFLAFLFPYIIPFFLYLKSPRGLWKFIDRFPTEDEILTDKVKRIGGV